MTLGRQIPDTITVHVAFRIVKRGGRKRIDVPTSLSPTHQIGYSLVKALARAFRWQRMLESGKFPTIGDLAADEKIASSYMTRIMRLMLLSPEIVEGIVDGRVAPGLAEIQLT